MKPLRLPAAVTLLALAFSVAGCGRYWTERSNTPPDFKFPAQESLVPDLRDCVAKNDPDWLPGIRQADDYPEIGLFSSSRSELVSRCMKERGWENMPTWAGL